MSTFGTFLATGGASTTAGGAPGCSLMVFSAPAYHRTLASDGGAPAPRRPAAHTSPDARLGRRGPSPATSCGSHFTGRSPRTAGPQPRDVLRLTLHRTLASDGGAPAP